MVLCGDGVHVFGMSVDGGVHEFLEPFFPPEVLARGAKR